MELNQEIPKSLIPSRKSVGPITEVSLEDYKKFIINYLAPDCGIGSVGSTLFTYARGYQPNGKTSRGIQAIHRGEWDSTQVSLVIDWYLFIMV